MRKKYHLQTKFRSMVSISVLLAMCCYSLYGCAIVAPTAATVAVGEVSLSKGRANVLVTEDEKAIKDCTFIKEVEAESYWGGLLFRQKAINKTIADLTHQTAEAGANVLLITYKSNAFMGSRSEGVAYRCPTEKAAKPANEPLTVNSPEKSGI